MWNALESIDDLRPQLMLTPEPIDAFGPPTVVPDLRVWETLGVANPDGGPGFECGSCKAEKSVPPRSQSEGTGLESLHPDRTNSSEVQRNVFVMGVFS